MDTNITVRVRDLREELARHWPDWCVAAKRMTPADRARFEHDVRQAELYAAAALRGGSVSDLRQAQAHLRNARARQEGQSSLETEEPDRASEAQRRGGRGDWGC